MDWLQVISIIIGSSLLTKFVDILYSSYKSRKEEDNERQKQLYSQLKFFIKLIKICKTTREELWNDRDKAFKEKTENIQDHHQKGDLLMKNLNDSKEFTTKLISDNWAYVDSIKKLLEENIKYIRQEDWPIVERFFKEYFIREIVTGKGTYKDTSHIFTFKKIEEAFDGIFNVINEMDKIIKI